MKTKSTSNYFLKTNLLYSKDPITATNACMSTVALFPLEEQYTWRSYHLTTQHLGDP